MFKNIHYFPHILHCCGSSLPSPVSMKPHLLKSTLCSDWSAGAECCDWLIALSVFGKCPAPHHNRQFNTVLTQPGHAPLFCACLGWELLMFKQQHCTINNVKKTHHMIPFNNLKNLLTLYITKKKESINNL